MTKPPQSPAPAAFVAATAGRNMTGAASIAVALGICAMVLSTMDAAQGGAHRWIVALFWGCLAFFVVEWGVRVQQAARKRRTATYLLSGRGLLDTAMPSPCPRAGPGRRSAHRLAVGPPPGVLKGIPRRSTFPARRSGSAKARSSAEMALGNSLRSANIGTTRLSKLLVFDLVDFRVLMARHPDLAQSIDAEAQRRAMENRT